MKLVPALLAVNMKLVPALLALLGAAAGHSVSHPRVLQASRPEPVPARPNADAQPTSPTRPTTPARPSAPSVDARSSASASYAVYEEELAKFALPWMAHPLAERA